MEKVNNSIKIQEALCRKIRKAKEDYYKHKSEEIKDLLVSGRKWKEIWKYGRTTQLLIR